MRPLAAAHRAGQTEAGQEYLSKTAAILVVGQQRPVGALHQPWLSATGTSAVDQLVQPVLIQDSNLPLFDL
jgi:hypothetical protein